MSVKSNIPYQVSLVDFDWYRRNVPCQYACPVATPAGRYARLIYQGAMEQAYRAARDPNPLMHVCARICAHPCEAQCRRGTIGEPVSIRALKRTLSEYWQTLPEEERPRISVAKTREEQIAVVGAGPAGIAAAAALLQKGYGVTILESTDKAGGMLEHGIPSYRLPREVIGCDIQFILENGGEIKTQVALGKDYSLDDLERQGFAALFLGVGAIQAQPLAIDGSDLPGVHLGIDFLRSFNQGQPMDMGTKVAIIGGGNVAIDVARAIKRLPPDTGKREVTMLVLEGRDEMLAFEEEIEEAVAEGVIIKNSVGPKRFLEQEGSVGAVETLKVESVYDEQGNFNPQFVPEPEATIEVDTVVIAIGQKPDLSFLEGLVTLTSQGTIWVDPETMATSRKGVFAGGDGVSGPRLAIDAVAQGIRAAEAIHAYLTAEQPAPKHAAMRTLAAKDLPPEADTVTRSVCPTLPLYKRGPSDEVSRALPQEAALREASRCLDCYIQTVFDSAKCILCGGCVDVCPMRCLRLVDLTRITGDDLVRQVIEAGCETAEDHPVSGDGTAILKDEQKCLRCGLCQTRCPTNAITMEYFDENGEDTNGAQ